MCVYYTINFNIIAKQISGLTLSKTFEYNFYTLTQKLSNQNFISNNIWLDDLGVGNSYSNALGLRDQRQFSTVKKYMLSCFFFMLSWIMFFFSFSFSMLLWKTNLTFLSIYIYDFKIVLPCYFDSGRVIFLEKFNRSSFIVVLNLYGTNIL